MTSLEIAELTGKQHKNVMQAIINMEPAWEKIAGLKFQLGSYEDANGQLRPCYSLTKTECLYIATKFNDEARAKLVLRWEELEEAEVRRKREDVRCLPSPKEILQLADEIIGEGLRLLNEAAEDTLTATQVAKTFNMTVFDFNAVLQDMGSRSGDGSLIYCFLLQQLSVAIPFQYLHLLNGNMVEFHETFTLRHAVIDEDSIDVFHIREANEFVDSGIVADESNDS